MSRTARGARTLSGRYYTADSVFEEETERIFRRRWIGVGRTSGLNKTGEFKLKQIEGESIIVLRDGESRLRAFYNVCRHRGARLCSQPLGQFRESIQCPYHAWTYSLDGRLIGAPNMRGQEGFNAREYGLAAVAVREWEGFAFVNFSEPPPSFDESFRPVLGKFHPWKLDRLSTAHRIEYQVAANWKLLFQNYSECYHCPAVHPALNRLTPYRGADNDLEDGPVLGGPMALAPGHDSLTADGRACAPPIVENGSEQSRLVYYYTVFPNFFLSLHPDYVLTHRLERLGPMSTRVICDWLFDPEAVAASDFDPSPAVEFWDLTNRQDWKVCELCQQGVASRGYRPGPYSGLESIAAAFDREYLAALAFRK